MWCVLLIATSVCSPLALFCYVMLCYVMCAKLWLKKKTSQRLLPLSTHGPRPPSPFTHLWVFTLFYPISARLPSNLLEIRDNSSSLLQLGRDTYSTVVSEATFQKYQGSLYPIVVSEATFQKYRELPYLPTELSTPSSKTYNLGDDLWVD